VGLLESEMEDTPAGEEGARKPLVELSSLESAERTLTMAMGGAEGTVTTAVV
jgi:hypothetical protein